MTEVRVLEGAYGNWRVPRSPGIMGFDLASSVMLLGGVIAVILSLMLAGLVPALVITFAVAVGMSLFMRKDRHGLTAGVKIANRARYRKSVKLGSHQYRSGPLGKARYGACQLPGVLAPTRLDEFVDSWGRPFAVLSMPTRGHYSIVFSAQTEGGSLVDEEQVKHWVGRYAYALGQLGEENGVIAAQVTLETVPDTGRELREHVTSRLDPHAPELAVRTMMEITDRYGAGSTQTRAWITFVFASQIDGKKLSVDEFAQTVKPRVRGIGELFHSSGVGLVEPLAARELCELARSSYDPAAGELLEQERLAGRPVELDWSEVGPTGGEAGWDYYRHDTGLSMTWGMTVAPRGLVQPTVLGRLLAPSPRVARKRVQILYRVPDPGEAAATVERDQRTAEFNLGGSRRNSPQLRAEALKAEQTAQEQERGAGLVDFALLLTATVDGEDPDAKQIAEAAIGNLAATARLVLRKQFGSQDSAFAGCLPFGVVLSEYLSVPRIVRKAAA